MNRPAALLVLATTPLACSAVLGIHDIAPPAEGGAPDTGQESAPQDARQEREPAEASADVADVSTGPADAGGEPCAADTGIDPLNCGSCGHSCLGAPCAGGMCTPSVLVDKIPNQPIALAVDSTNLYFAAANYIDYCPVAGCAQLAVPVTRTGNALQTSITSLAEGPGATLYFTTLTQDSDGGETGEVESKVFGSGASFPNVVSPSPTVPAAILLCGATVCWVSAATAISSVNACTPPSCTGAIPVWKGMVNLVSTLGWDGKLLYFSDGSNIDSVDPGNPMPPATAAQSQGVLAVTFGAGNLFWLAFGSTAGSLMQCTPPMCDTTTRTLASGMTGLGYLAVDDAAVYWTVNRAPGEVDSCAIGGCGGTPRVVASQQSNPQAITIDAQKVYWAAQSGSTYQILWVAK